jgi:peptide/nickel transport system ATP-binding protein
VSEIVEVSGLAIAFPRPEGGFRRVVDGVTLGVAAAGSTAVVGESGCGKSLSALALLGLLPAPGRVEAGSVRVAGLDVRAAGEQALCRLRGRVVGLLLQEPGQALNPVRPVWRQVTEALHVVTPGSSAHRRDETARLLAEVGLEQPESLGDAYAHQLSGGQQQRVLLAAALAAGPQLLIADEPTAALDAMAQEDVLALLGRLRRDRGMALLVISHDLRIVDRLAERAVVMHAGETVEIGSRDELLLAPSHPYTRAMVATYAAERGSDGRFATIAGEMPGPDGWGLGCRFASRCPVAVPRCLAARPALHEVSPGHLVRCFLEGSAEEPVD